MKLEKVAFTEPCPFAGITSEFWAAHGWDIEEVNGDIHLNHRDGRAFVARGIGCWMVPKAAPIADDIDTKRSLVPATEPRIEIPPPAATPAESPNAKRGKR